MSQTPVIGTTATPSIPINASNIFLADPGGYGFGGLTIEQAFALFMAGGIGAFLTKVGGERHTVNPLGTMAATEVIDLALGNEAWGTLAEDCTITFTGWTPGEGCRVFVELIEDATGGWTPTFTGVTWLGGTAPSHTTTPLTVTHYAFFSRDGGTTIWGGQIPGASSSGGGQTPYYIPVGETFTVPLYKQALFSEPIEVDGGLIVNGLLIGVD